MTKGTDYTVEKKDEIRKLTSAGEVQIVYRIWANSKGGTRFSVEVPEASLVNADQVLTTKAKQLDSI